MQELLDGPGKYELVAIVSHIGSNTACGHYVAHVKKDGLWYIFNDEKVALSEKLPIGHGYMYLYRCARFFAHVAVLYIRHQGCDMFFMCRRADQPWS